MGADSVSIGADSPWTVPHAASPFFLPQAETEPRPAPVARTGPSAPTTAHAPVAAPAEDEDPTAPPSTAPPPPVTSTPASPVEHPHEPASPPPDDTPVPASSPAISVQPAAPADLQAPPREEGGAPPTTIRLRLALQARLQGSGYPSPSGRLDLVVSPTPRWLLGAWLLAPRLSPVTQAFAGEPRWSWSTGLGLWAPGWASPGVVLGLARRRYLPAALGPGDEVAGLVPLAGLEAMVPLLPQHAHVLRPAIRLGVVVDLRRQEFAMLGVDLDGSVFQDSAEPLSPLAFRLDLLLEWTTQLRGITPRS